MEEKREEEDGDDGYTGFTLYPADPRILKGIYSFAGLKVNAHFLDGYNDAIRWVHNMLVKSLSAS